MNASSRRSIAALASVVLAVDGCGSPDMRPPDARPGHLVVERVRRGRSRLVDAPAQATYCAEDSVLVIVAVDRYWAAGLALRTPFPVAASRAVRIGGALAGEGTGTAALRSVADSVERALVAVGGTAQLGVGRLAAGTFDVTVPALRAGRPPEHLLGAFAELPTTTGATPCSSLARTP